LIKNHLIDVEPPAESKPKSDDAAHSDHHDHASGHGGHSGHQSSALCGGEWKYPVTCDKDTMDCLYYAKWEYIERTDDIRFTLRSNLSNRWLGIGFADGTSMVNYTFSLPAFCT
jgi:hypothetical protein